MSKQLAISSSFSIFALACLMVLSTEDRLGVDAAQGALPVQIEAPSFDLPQPDLLP